MRYLDEKELNNILNTFGSFGRMNDKADKYLKIELCYLLWKSSSDNSESEDSLFKKVLVDVLDRLKVDSIDSIFEDGMFDATSCVRLAENIEKATKSWSKYDINDSSPSLIVDVVYSLLDIHNKDSLCDFGCGDGQFLLSVAQKLNSNNIKTTLSGYELSPEKILVTECLLEMEKANHSIMLLDFVQEHDECKYDKGFLFPPYGIRYPQELWDGLVENYKNIFTSRSESEFLYILKALEKIKENGKLITLVPTGLTFRTSGEKVRQYLYDNHLIEGIISLPGGILDFTSIPLDVWVLSKKANHGIKLLDATEMKLSEVSENSQVDATKIVEEYLSNAYQVKDEEIKEHNYSFSKSIYIVSDTLKSIPNPTHINEVCKIEKGSQYTVSKFSNQISESPTNYQLLTSANIQDGYVNFDSLPYVQDDEKLLKFKLEENDLVVTTKSTVFKTYVAQDLPKTNIIVTGGMIIIRPDLRKVNPTYLKMFLDSEIGKHELAAIGKGAVIVTISPATFEKEIIIPCPSIESQNELANSYNNLLWMINGMNKQISEMKDQLNNMFEESMEEEE